MKKIISTLIITLIIISITPKIKVTAEEIYQEVNVPKGSTLVIPNGSSGYVKTNATRGKTYSYYTRDTHTALIHREITSQEVYISGEMRFETNSDVVFSVPQSVYSKIVIENQPLFEKVLLESNKGYKLSPGKDGLMSAIVINYDENTLGVQLQLDYVNYEENGEILDYGKGKSGETKNFIKIANGGKIEFSNTSKDMEYALVPTVHVKDLVRAPHVLFYNFTLKPGQSFTSINHYYNENEENIDNFKYDITAGNKKMIETTGYNKYGDITKIGNYRIMVQEYKVRGSNITLNDIFLYVPNKMKGNVNITNGVDREFHKVTIKTGESFHLSDKKSGNNPISIYPTYYNVGNYDMVRLNDNLGVSEMSIGKNEGVNSSGGKYIDIKNNHGNPLEIYILEEDKDKYKISNEDIIVNMDILPDVIYKIDTINSSSFIAKHNINISSRIVDINYYNNDYSFYNNTSISYLNIEIPSRNKGKFRIKDERGGTMYVPVRLKGYINRIEDIDCSGSIDIMDLSLVSKYYNTKPSYSGGFNNNVDSMDRNNNYFIDIYDIVKVAREM